jgi:hypothetical protein
MKYHIFLCLADEYGKRHIHGIGILWRKYFRVANDTGSGVYFTGWRRHPNVTVTV